MWCGLDELLFTKRSECYHIVRFQSSKKCENRFSESNIWSVNAGIISGNGLSNIQKIMSHLNLPRLVTSTSYNIILEKISVNIVDIAEQSMIKASSTLISMYNDNYDDTDIESCEKRSRKSSAIRWDMAKKIWFQLLTGCCFFHFCWLWGSFRLWNKM